MVIDALISEDDNYLPFESVDKFLEKVSELEIETIEIDGGIILNNKTMYLNSESSPILYIDNLIFSKTLSISGDFYNNNKEQVDDAVAKTISLNAERQAISFPKRYKINQDGSQEIYIDETEKFGAIKK